MADNLEQTLRDMIDAGGNFWIGSTSKGRHMIDKAPRLEEVLKLAACSFALRKALQLLLERYLEVANSGDCGFWNPEEEDVVIAVRKALAQ